MKLIYCSLIIILFYVDDLLIKGIFEKEIVALKSEMNHAFSMTDLGLLSQFLGLEISQSDLGIKVHQSKYASDLLKKFRMKDCKLSKTHFLSGVKLKEAQSTPLENNTLYRKLVGCLLYLTYTQPDISYEMSVASRCWVYVISFACAYGGEVRMSVLQLGDFDYLYILWLFIAIYGYF